MKQLMFVMLLCAMIASCTNNLEDPRLSDDMVVEPNDSTVLIVDRTGKQWDVTHAVEHYGFVAEDFQFGLGPNAIQPIQNPQFLEPGDPSYPDTTETFLVIGVNMQADQRAYPIDVLSRHEIANEEIGGEIVAVGY